MKDHSCHEHDHTAPHEQLESPVVAPSQTHRRAQAGNEPNGLRPPGASGDGAVSTPLREVRATEAPTETEHRAEYRSLMKKWWFSAAISIPVIFFSYPSLFGLGDLLPAGSDALRLVWGGLGLLSLPVLLW
ncbi:MAG: hypothetical protein WD205_11080, partial [Rhodothermales bacterium]